MKTMKTFKNLFIASLCLSLVSLARANIREEAPPMVDPFVGIIDKNVLKVADNSKVIEPQNKRVAVILSGNADTHLKWSQDRMAGLSGFDKGMMSIFASSAVVAESDRLHKIVYTPKVIVDALISPIVHRVKSVEVISDVNTFRSGEFDVLAILDVGFVNKFSDGFLFGGTYATGTYMKAIFVDKSALMLGTVEVGETVNVERDKFLYAVADHRKVMYSRYEQAISTLLGPVQSKPDRPLKRSIADRLKEIDQLVKENLLTPQEAAARRNKILDDI
jgi:hypothetical protein